MVITKTPLRVSFVGGGTDLKAYYQSGYGAVVSAAIEKYVYVTVHKRFDSSIRVSYTSTETVAHVDDLKHSIVKACLKMVGIDNGLEITTIGEVPAGTGLGSSSSLTVGLLNALYSYIGVSLSSEELMNRACIIEINVLGNPIGKQDQSAAAFGGINYFRFNADETVERERIWLSDDDYRLFERRLMMFYTGIRRSANDILQKQEEETNNKLSVLDFMRDQADDMRQMLIEEGFHDGFARMLSDGWQKKREMTGLISNDEIDGLYQRALNAGAMGGKLLGAGGGGFLLLYCLEERQQAVRAALGLKELNLRVATHGSQVVYFE